MKEKLYNDLHKLYSLSKTLRFELKPIGKTIENMKEAKIIEDDTNRKEYYKKVKKYCDEYHKDFIDRVLSNVKLNKLNEYYKLYSIEKKDEKQDKELEKIKTSLRETIGNAFKKDSEYNGLFGKDIIEKYLPKKFQRDEDKKYIDEFKKFTTYFSGYNTNRKNMYVADDKSTSIAYRLIDENLPDFISNMKVYQKIKDKIDTQKIYEKLKDGINASSMDEVFSLEYYNNVLTQKGIESYNLIISGNEKIQGLNECINLYKQQTKENLPEFKEIYKQILADRESSSFVFETIENDKELIDMLDDYVREFSSLIIGEKKNIQKFLESVDSYDITKIYVNNDTTLTGLSQKIYKEWRYIQDKLYEDYEKRYTGKAKISSEKYNDARDKHIKSQKVFSIAKLDEVCEDNKLLIYIKDGIKNFEGNKVNEEKPINLIEKVIECLEKYNEIKTKYYKEEKELIKKGKDKEDDIKAIKDLLDYMKELQEFVKIVVPKDRGIDKDDAFYNELMKYYDVLSGVIPVYNKIRNYITQKPFSKEKTKINFQCPTLLNGWDSNKEKAYLGVILLKDDNYYLGIMNPYCKNIFDENRVNIDENKNYKKMEYKQLSGLNKNLPRIAFAECNAEKFNPPEELKRKYEEGRHKKGDNFDIEFCHELIDFFKSVIHSYDYWKDKDIKFSDTSIYNDIGEFYRELEQKLYDINYKEYDEDYIDELVYRGELYLFQIYNKDFSPYSKGKKNLHTLYWKAIFDEKNLEDVVYKLNGQAEVFYRKASLKLEDTAIHKANEDVENKNEETKKRKPVSRFSYDLIKNKRYTEDKFLFHVPITLNFKNKNFNAKDINKIVNRRLKQSDDYYVIGVDRGERNLIYISVVDKHGKIVYKDSLNKINNNGNETDYHDLLDKKEKERGNARKSWKTIENIKELKEGYISQVINKIVNLMKKYNAIIVLENLNYAFKNSRIKVEKQVYQKFEKMLIEKLNYLVFKDNNWDEEGGVLNAYQLTNKFESFEKLGRQSGILFYIPAWCTSKIDPTTGFVNLFYVKYENIQEAKEFVSKFEDIRYNEEEDFFEFDIDYIKFTDRLNDSKRHWTICTYKDRIENLKNNKRWESRKVEITKDFKKLFNEHRVDINNIKKSIREIDDGNFFKKFMRLFKLTVQMRNSVINDDKDYLISPVRNKYGKFFDTREQDRDSDLPDNADANGAYNIARKGLMLIKQIKDTDDNKLSQIKYDITNKEWLSYAQDEENL